MWPESIALTSKRTIKNEKVYLYILTAPDKNYSVFQCELITVAIVEMFSAWLSDEGKL